MKPYASQIEKQVPLFDYSDKIPIRFGELDKYNVKAYKMLAQFYRWSNQSKKAKQVLKRLFDTIKDPALYKELVMVFDEKEKHRLKAIKSYLSILKTNPSNGDWSFLFTFQLSAPQSTVEPPY